MARFFYATIIGLLGAALVHLAIVLMLPRLSSNDLWEQMEAATTPYQPLRLDTMSPPLTAAATRDPQLALVACRYDLADGVFMIKASGRVKLWMVAAFDDRGNVVFSGNDRIAASEKLDLAIATDFQIRTIKQDLPESLSNSIVASADRRMGFAVVRVYRPDASWTPIVDDFISHIRCEPVPL